ncbi:MAG: prenyltransferase/squalene oxidase repeat-containing protein [Kiritimatiellia bacterium]|jgi:squalene-hopene/tetraprenyl-beta-curcumene cyclase|nr:prenyltransferase/squalene oxidase repeat-containing protein [Kiritimatiellia bacterium]MDP6849252.1 prenyltransferase/squalene oxidase repeat-containing protein [Kiritimatiellia bacterium]
MDAETETALRETLANAEAALLNERCSEGHWEGELSSSALSTAVAVFALGTVDPRHHGEDITKGLEWLSNNVNADGGWGDSPGSPSNISTTLLCWSAFTIDCAPERPPAETHAAEWLTSRIGGIDPESIEHALSDYYGKDRTFSAPILTMCALAGRLGPGSAAWRLVPQLPYDLAILPRFLFRWLHLPVVSYALPALISIGLIRYKKMPDANALVHVLRKLTEKEVLSVLKGIQPGDGGFLEAIPLTSFVVMSLAASGYGDNAVTRKGVDFIKLTVRKDGSWPIDTNLATWLTTLSINAMLPSGNAQGHLSTEEEKSLAEWLLAQQYRKRHAYTGASPGGWAWTNLPGGVPDADDTAGALLALKGLQPACDETRSAAESGLQWLIDLQNRDGGLPTFCRGWGRLPFDRSCPDITAHALLAFEEWYDWMAPRMQVRINASMHAAVAYLESSQSEDGYWLPLWFGNQNSPSRENPVYGTSLVVFALKSISPERLPRSDVLLERGRHWIIDAQNEDGGWGGGKGGESSIEETALAVRALAVTGDTNVASRGATWLARATECGSVFPTTPIGLYFASLWYSEKLYPMIFTVSALNQLLEI